MLSVRWSENVVGVAFAQADLAHTSRTGSARGWVDRKNLLSHSVFKCQRAYWQRLAPGTSTQLLPSTGFHDRRFSSRTFPLSGVTSCTVAISSFGIGVVALGSAVAPDNPSHVATWVWLP